LRSWTLKTFKEPIGLAKLRGRIPRVNAAAIAGFAVLLLFSMVLVMKMWRSAGSAAVSGAAASARPTEALVTTKPSATEPMASMKAGQFISKSVSTEVQRPLQNAAATDRILNSTANEPGGPAVAATPTPTTRPAASATAEVIAPPDLSSAVTPASAGIVPLPSTPASLPTLGVAVSDGVIEGELTHRVQPVYPMFARERHLEGAVVLRVLIAEDGAVRHVDIVRGDSTLAQAAVGAVRQWRYKPYQLNNRPVSTTIDVTINFKMQ
jgi:protein TonB